MIRTDILEHRSQFQTLCNKIQESHPDLYVDPVGLKLIDAELGKCREGKLNNTLKNFNRVLRRYIEQLPTHPATIPEFNAACEQVARGRLHDQAIRQARNSLRKTNAQNKSSDSKNRHDKILEDILSI